MILLLIDVSFHLVSDALRLRHDDGAPSAEEELAHLLVLLGLLPGDRDHGGQEALVSTALVALGLDAEVKPVLHERRGAGGLERR